MVVRTRMYLGGSVEGCCGLCIWQGWQILSIVTWIISCFVASHASPSTNRTSVPSPLFRNTKVLVDYLQQKHLVASNMVCSNCGTAFGLRQQSVISGGYIFRCGSCNHLTSKSLRAGSFFSKSKISFQQWLVLLYWWVCKYPVTDAVEEAATQQLMHISGLGKCVPPNCFRIQFDWKVLAKLFR